MVLRPTLPLFYRIGLTACAFVLPLPAFGLPTGEIVISGQNTLPTGGTVSSGTATFSSNGNVLTITSTPGTVINWQGFSIGAGATANFVQPSTTSTVVNRVVSQSMSTIAGTLQSNGRVFLVNPSGVLFSPGAQVNTSAFTFTTANAPSSELLAGKSPTTGSTFAVEGSLSVTAGSVSITPTGILSVDGAVNVTGSLTFESPGLSLPAGATVNTSEAHLIANQTSVVANSTVVFNVSASSTNQGSATPSQAYNNPVLLLDTAVRPGARIEGATFSASVNSVSVNAGANATAVVVTTGSASQGSSVSVPANVIVASVAPTNLPSQRSTVSNAPNVAHVATSIEARAPVATITLRKREPLH